MIREGGPDTCWRVGMLDRGPVTCSHAGEGGAQGHAVRGTPTHLDVERVVHDAEEDLNAPPARELGSIPPPPPPPPEAVCIVGPHRDAAWVRVRACA